VAVKEDYSYTLSVGKAQKIYASRFNPKQLVEVKKLLISLKIIKKNSFAFEELNLGILLSCQEPNFCSSTYQ